MSYYNLEIRTASYNKTKLLTELCAKTFLEAYINKISKENMKEYIKDAFNKSIILSELKDKKSSFLIVFSGEKAIGYAKLKRGKNPKELKNQKAIEIERMYILKKFTRKGIGKLLMKKCLEIAKKEKYKIMWLGVWENNKNAITFYKKFGFSFFGLHIFKIGNEKHNDLLLKKEI